MEFIQSMVDSAETAVNLGLFKSLSDSSYHHIFKVTFTMMPMKTVKTLENIDSKRFSSDPYPPDDRPRGKKDLDSVKFHRREIVNSGQTSPIWVAKKGNRLIKLDGVHRIVATHLEHKRSIPCYIVHID